MEVIRSNNLLGNKKWYPNLKAADKPTLEIVSSLAIKVCKIKQNR